MMNPRFSIAFLASVVCLLFACTPNNTIIDNSLKKHFDDNKVEGTFGIWDNGQNRFTIYNLERFRDSAYLPASTFKVVNSLIALHTGRIFGDTVVIKWDGATRFYPNGDTAKLWNKDLSMKEAFKASAVPYYQEVARRIGKDTMQMWLDSLKYGSRKITSAIDTFWLDNSLKVTADEQVGLMKKLYFKQLVFNSRSQEIVQHLMLQEDNDKYKLSYKTGWGYLPNGNPLGWAIGWIQENKHVYFFAMNLESKDHNADIGKMRLDILKAILKQLGFFEGKK